MKVLTNLLFLILVCVGGLFALEKFGVIALNEEENTDNDVSETLPEEVEVLTFTLKHGSYQPVTLEFENGMTWEEWIDSDYNNFTELIGYNGDGWIKLVDGSVQVRITSSVVTTTLNGSDLVEAIVYDTGNLKK